MHDSARQPIFSTTKSDEIGVGGAGGASLGVHLSSAESLDGGADPYADDHSVEEATTKDVNHKPHRYTYNIHFFRSGVLGVDVFDLETPLESRALGGFETAMNFLGNIEPSR